MLFSYRSKYAGDIGRKVSLSFSNNIVSPIKRRGKINPELLNFFIQGGDNLKHTKGKWKKRITCAGKSEQQM